MPTEHQVFVPENSIPINEDVRILSLKTLTFSLPVSEHIADV
jgi:hypothetical protein